MQIVSGRPKRATFALLHSIGPAVGSVDQLTGSRKSTGDVAKAKMRCGALLSERSQKPSQCCGFFQTQEGFLSTSTEAYIMRESFSFSLSWGIENL